MRPQRSALRLAVLVVLCSLAGAAEQDLEPVTEAVRPGEPPTWYRAAAEAAGYAEATAHQPRFTDAALWNDDARRAAYATQTWPAARVLVWAKPGSGAKDGWEAKHWLEDGKPATAPIDPDTDLVLPPADRSYWVSLTNGRKYQPAAFRHLTIGRNAGVSGHFATRGNLWVKQGGHLEYMDQVVGDGHVFVRIDTPQDRWKRRGMTLVDHFHFRKDAAGSVEFIGIFRSEDNWQIHSGTMIVAPQSEIGMGNRTAPIIAKGATVAIMSGGYLTRRSNCDWDTDITVLGRLSGGLPERPLTTDARLGLGWKSKGAVLGNIKSSHRTPGPSDLGMRVAEGGEIRVHTADPARARLLIDCSRRDCDWAQIEIISRGHPLHGDPAIAKLKELPRLTDMAIEGTVDWRGLRLDGIRRGGIHVRSLPPLDGADAPAFGARNEATPAHLFAVTP